jgi:hypothetical protein
LRIFARGGDQLDWSAIGGLAALDADVAHRTVNRPAQPSVE